MNTPRSVHIKTFGCQMNVYDSDRMSASLQTKGYRVEPNPANADVILINTCSIRAKSEQKVLSLLGQLRPLKKKNPEMVIGVAGCVGQRMGRTLLQRVPHLDLVFGPDSIDRVFDLVESARRHGKRAVDTQMDGPGRTYTQPAVIHEAKPAEFLTIMKGCDHFCTYCIVPFVRGREKSRPIAEVLDDVRKLVARGTREVTFLGQNINTYGKGTPENLAQLIEQTHAIEGLERIRYVTSHPRDLGTDLIEQFGRLEKLCPSLHLPFQSGSDRILKRMSRLYTREQYLEKIRLLKQACPEIALSTDIIVGFPGETEEDFQSSIDVVREVGFTMAYMFKYSPRPGTRAFAYEGEEVPESVKDERLARLQDIAMAPIEAGNVALIGTKTPVLIESMDKKALYYSGRSPHNRRVHVLNAGDACIGKILEVEVTEANASNLRGYYVGAPRLDRRSQEGLPAPVCHA
ncbi:tRNA (N6-isopentenyl adenosine(37)-C2)-methylthiotransferase MiaB [bacterium]|nr:tRNA (N6-isopentenyl adenosine(37)-C2)-methylthiotransferase MiaB [bacterium]